MPTTSHIFNISAGREGSRELAIDCQEIGGRILRHLAASLLDPRNGFCNRGRVTSTERTVDLDIGKVAVRLESDELVGSNEASKPALVGAAGG